MTLRRDRRGLAVGFVLFFAALLIAALLYILLNPAMDAVSEMMLDQAESQDATDTINERMSIWNGLLFFAVFCAGLFIIARSTFESRGP